MIHYLNSCLLRYIRTRMKEWLDYLITFQCEVFKPHGIPARRLVQEKFTWKESELFEYILQAIESYRKKEVICDLLNITANLVWEYNTFFNKP